MMKLVFDFNSIIGIVLVSFGIGMFIGMIIAFDIKDKINKFKNRKENK